MCAGSLQARTTRTWSWLGSSSAASCAPPMVAEPGTTTPRAQLGTYNSLAWHPSVEGRGYEAGGDGAAWSEDAGETWRPANEGRDRHYTWSVTVDPADPDLWYVSASTGAYAAHGRADPRARIYRRGNGGWRPLRGGLPEPLSAMPYALVATDERLFAGLADGQLWESGDRGETWRASHLKGGKLTRLRALAHGPA